jgi:hypothetical protein
MIMNVFYVSGLTVVLYECETCPFTLREENRLKLFGNSILLRTFQQVTSGRRNLYNEGLHNLYSSPTKCRDSSVCIATRLWPERPRNLG